MNAKGSIFYLEGLKLEIDYSYELSEDGGLEVCPVQGGITEIDKVICNGKDITDLLKRVSNDDTLEYLIEAMEEEISERY